MSTDKPMTVPEIRREIVRLLVDGHVRATPGLAPPPRLNPVWLEIRWGGEVQRCGVVQDTDLLDRLLDKLPESFTVAWAERVTAAIIGEVPRA